MSLPKGLVHIKKQYDILEKEYLDISDEKIYYDSISGQYKHKFVCGCGKEIGCFCFDSIDDAVSGTDIGMTCEDCSISDFLGECLFEDEHLQKLIDTCENTRLYMIHQLKDAIEDGYIYQKATDEFIDTRLEKLDNEVDQIKNSLSEETKKKIISYMIDCDWFDCEWGGTACTT